MSPSGFPFLVLRKDTGKYAYQRDLNQQVATHLSGEITLDWAARTARLEPGRSVIKISFSTGDEKMARLRWLHVHAQVEALIQLAQIAANNETVRKSALRTMQGLEPKVIATIAGQMEHDRLAAHDKGWIDPTFTSPLASVVLKLSRKGTSARPDENLVEFARRKAHRGGSGNLHRCGEWSFCLTAPGWVAAQERR